MRRFLSVVLLLPFALAPALPSSAKRPLRHGGPVTSHHGNLSMEVADAAEAVQKAERAVLKVGGTVQHASSNTQNGSLSASLPVSQLGPLMRVVENFNGRVTDSSTSSSDLTSSMRMAKERVHDLELAEAALGRAMKTADDADTQRGFFVLAELVNRERQNARSQLDNLETQADRAQLHMSFVRPR